MTHGDGKRGYVRVNDRFDVRVVKSGAGSRRSEPLIDTTKSVNVSATGLLLSMDTKLEVGDMVTVTFMKPHTFEFFRGVGRVIHVQGDGERLYRVGIQFIDLTPEDRNTLDYYITLGTEQESYR